MKHIKMISAIIIAAILCAGCAETKDESSVPEVTTTAATTTEATTTAATTTTVTEATTTASTEETQENVEPEPDQIVESDPVADQIAQERDDAIYTPTTEEAEDHAQDRENRQDMADNTSNYTTEGIPLTTDGDLTAPAKPTADYELPANAQLEFTGNPDTALLTELPDGCYWTPTPGYINGFTDPAGNYWMNQKSDILTGNSGEGYRTPDGDEHPSQAEIDRAIAFNQASQERWDNGPTGDGMSNMTDQEIADLDAMLGI